MARDEVVVNVANGGWDFVAAHVGQHRILQVGLENHATPAEPQRVIHPAVYVQPEAGGHGQIIFPIVQDPRGGRLGALEDAEVEQNHWAVKHFARGREPVVRQHGVGVAAVVIHAQRAEQALALVRLHGDIGCVSVIAQARDGRVLAGALDGLAQIGAIGRGVGGDPFGFGMVDGLQHFAQARHARAGIGVDGEPMRPIGVILQAPGGQQAVFGNRLAGLLAQGVAALRGDPIGRADHAGQGALQPRVVARHEIVLRQRPQYRAVVEVITGGRVIALVVDFGPVVHGLLVIGVSARERPRTLQLDERFQIFGGRLVIAQQIQRHRLEAAFVGVHGILVTGRRDHEQAALGIFGGAQAHMHEHGFGKAGETFFGDFKADHRIGGGPPKSNHFGAFALVV